MFPFGVTFYPDQWPEEAWEENFRRIKEAGFNCVRFNEMAWDWIQPSEREFDFKGLDKALDLCHKYGLRILLGIPTSQAPTWLIKKYNQLRPMANDGTLYPEYGPRPNVCRDSRIYRKYALQMAAKLVSQVKKHPAVWMWQIDNEPVYAPLDDTTSKDYCHCEATRQAFIAWAKNKYKTLENLNQKWGTKFWTCYFSRWEDISTPKCGIWDAGNPHIFLDWMNFKSESLADWLHVLKKTVLKQDKTRKVGTNGFIGIPSRVPNHDVLAKEMDWYGLDIYPKGNGMDDEAIAFAADLWRGFCRGEFHVTELQGGANVRWGKPDYVEGPEIKRWVKILIEHGAEAILFHAWRPPLFGSETNGFGILKPDGSSTKRLEVIKEIAKEIRDLKVESRKLKVEKKQIAILYFRNAEIQTYQEQGPPRGISGQWEAVRSDIGLTHMLDSLKGAYTLAYKKHGKADFIFERHLESGNLPYETILLPSPYLLSHKQANQLINFVEKGGTLITEARFGVKNEHGHLYQNPLIEKLMGVAYDHGETKKDGFHDVVEGIKNKSIKTKKIGKGKVLYANFSLFMSLNHPKDRKNFHALLKLI